MTTAAAAAPGASIITMQHASWTAKDGAPTGITAIAQTSDGWLWIGSSVGLFRFDGARFERMTGLQAPLSSSIAGLGLLPDGRLWITYKYGGASLMSAGSMRHFRVGEHNMPGGTAACLGQDGDGRLWLGGARGLRLLAADGSWQAPEASMAAPTGAATDMLRDRSGVFWLRTGEAVYALQKHASRFEKRQAVAGYGKLGQHPDGSIWTSDTSRPGLHLVAAVSGSDARTWESDDKISYFLFDHAGDLWQPDYSGLNRITAAGAARLQHTGVEQGLSGLHGYAVFEDREQNIWVGTENGLDRFRPYRFSAVALPKYLGAARALAVRREGGVWVDRSLVSGPGAQPESFAPVSSVADLTSSLHAAPDGVLWSGGVGALWRIHDGRREAVPLPPALIDPATTVILSMATDETGALWVSFGRRGLYTLRDGIWQENGGVSSLAGLFPPVVASDAHRRTWFGSTDDRLMVRERGGVRRFGRAEGVSIGTVLAILPTLDGAWIGGENGIAYVDGRKVTSVTGRDDDPFAGTTGLVFASDGTLWVNGGAGISSIAPAELQRAVHTPGYQVQFKRFDYRDGIKGGASPITPFPSAVRSNEGALWFSTLGGVYTFDASVLPHNTLAPPVYVTALRVNGDDYPVHNGMQLPPHTEDLTVNFTALSLRAPERMRFRYQLAGLDQGWHETAGRRSVHYTNLAPGRYRFRVVASNDDGLWNEVGAQLSFEMMPGLTQTLWFRALCGLAVLLILWCLHRWRLVRMAAQMHLRMNERVTERTRIARALHDTILQSMQGIILHVHAARAVLAQDDPVRFRLDQVIVDADRAYAEGRDQVTALRVSPAGDIEGAITDTGDELMRDYPQTTFAFRVAGERARLRNAVAEELAEIAREAIRNAFRHADASKIDVLLDYGVRQLTLTARDNGKGMAGEAGEGHWGLVGMRERAARIRAELTIDGTSVPGTRIVVTVARRRAYADRRRAAWRR